MPQERDQLFVKVDGYQEVLEELDAVKQVMEQMQEALDVIREIRDVKEETITVFLDHLDDLNNRLDNIGRELPEVDTGNTITAPPTTAREGGEESRSRPSKGQAVEEEVIENSVKDLHQELRRLKNSLRDLEQ